MTRICFDILRRTSAPICDRDLAFVFMTARGMDTSDARLVKLILSGSAAACASTNAAGTVMSENGPGQTTVWRVASVVVGLS